MFADKEYIVINRAIDDSRDAIESCLCNTYGCDLRHPELREFDVDCDDDDTKRYIIIETGPGHVKNCKSCKRIVSYDTTHCIECNLCVPVDSIHCTECNMCYPRPTCVHLEWLTIPIHPLGDLIVARKGLFSIDELVERETNARLSMEKEYCASKYSQVYGCDNLLMLAIRSIHSVVQYILNDIQQLEVSDKIKLLTKINAYSGRNVLMLALRYRIPSSCMVSLLDLINSLPEMHRLNMFTKKSRFDIDVFGYATQYSPANHK